MSDQTVYKLSEYWEPMVNPALVGRDCSQVTQKRNREVNAKLIDAFVITQDSR
jgi:hypothetical protein